MIEPRTPEQRLVEDIEQERSHSLGHALLEYIATYGTDKIDAQALARRVFERMEGDDEEEAAEPEVAVVEVELSTGCPICHSTASHTHTQTEWDALYQGRNR